MHEKKLALAALVVLILFVAWRSGLANKVLPEGLRRAESFRGPGLGRSESMRHCFMGNPKNPFNACIWA